MTCFGSITAILIFYKINKSYSYIYAQMHTTKQVMTLCCRRWQILLLNYVNYWKQLSSMGDGGGGGFVGGLGGGDIGGGDGNRDRRVFDKVP